MPNFSSDQNLDNGLTEITLGPTSHNLPKV